MNLLVFIIVKLLHRFELIFSSRYIKQFNCAGKGIFIGREVKIEHPEHITIGDSVYLNDYLWISIIDDLKNKTNVLNTSKLCIGNNSYIGRFGTIAVNGKVVIGNDVLISDRVFIGASSHGFDRVDIPIRLQKMSTQGGVFIGDGTWVGINASILQNVTIGKNCVVGANSVVTRDVPDYSVVLGSPARVVRIIEP